eukprot:CAMPEP_0113936688 /NCGR_PEP_ID=MMETSP1339-20121228/3524_1 /TAXON_ID=94617 /ORGANISM="Fibrocapsa japonica" /LENGTH=74 /DNA_ID=CAMNT_0000939221 /DNA_START=314 /DNA_END=538 /DNA_ORIENTATION=+ /assembly_acc=CAM_ASM_000762
MALFNLNLPEPDEDEDLNEDEDFEYFSNNESDCDVFSEPGTDLMYARCPRNDEISGAPSIQDASFSVSSGNAHL